MNNTYSHLINHPEQFSQLAVKDVLFLHYICPQYEKYLYLFTHFNQIIFTMDGDKTFHVGCDSWRLTENTCLFARKTAWKQEIGSTGWELMSFYFPDSFLQNFFKEHRSYLPLKNLPPSPVDMLIPIHANDVIRAFFYSMLPYFSQQPPPTEQLLEMKFKELLFQILSNPLNAALLVYVQNLSDLHKPPLAEIMENNFLFNLTLNDYAKMSQRSLAGFKREFEKVYHSTPGKWLSEKRLNHAKHLLETSIKNVNEVAYDCGFENISHFSRVFKEKFGRAPLQYRKQHSPK